MLGAPSGAAAGVAGRAAAVPPTGTSCRGRRGAPAVRGRTARPPQLGRRASPWAPGCFSRDSGFSFQFLNQFLRVAHSLGSLEASDWYHVHIDLHYVHIDLHINNGKQAFLPASGFYFKRFILG